MDKLVLKDWYLGTPYHVERFAFGDGSVLSDGQVQGLAGANVAIAAPTLLDRGAGLAVQVA